MPETPFKRALNLVLKWEGGYKLHRNPGENEDTFAGIYRKYFPDWEGWKYIDQGDFESAESSVEEFYRQHYWNIIKGDYLPQNLAIVLFEASVNIGVRNAIKILQRAIKEDFKRESIIVDGIIGRQTIGFINQLDEKELILMFTKRRSIYYAKLDCDRFNRFKKGWFNREFDILKEVLL